MPNRNVKADFSPVTRPLNGTRKNTAHLAASDSLSSNRRRLAAIPSPAQSARRGSSADIPRNAAKIVSFEEAKKSRKRNASPVRQLSENPKQISRKLSRPISPKAKSADVPASNSRLIRAKTASVDKAKEPGEENASNAKSAVGRKARSEERKRAKAKARAEKKFDKLYGKKDSSSSASDNGPRAAVYAGKMGRSHKKSSKMQAAGIKGPASAAGFLWGKITSFSVPAIPKALIRSVLAVGIMAMFLAFLYAPAQQYYIQMRETDRLQAEYVEVATRTNNLAASIDSLNTTEGIEDKAHSDLGYVKSGEESGQVKGIAQINLLKVPTSNVAPGSIPAPDTWYSGTLDAIFGYNGQ